MTSLTTVRPGTGYTHYLEGLSDGRDLPAGRWIGSGSKAQGLSGEATVEQIASLFGDGMHPDRDKIIAEKLQTGWTPTNAELAAHLGSQHAGVTGFDLTLRPAKSISVLWGIGGLEARELVTKAQDHAVSSTVAFLEKHALAYRDGFNGIAQVALTGGVVAASFRHYTSLSGNPEIHDHVLIASRAQNHLGHWKLIDGRSLNMWLEPASEHYWAAIQGELYEQGIAFVPRSTEEDGRPVMEIAGLDEGLISRFSDESPCHGTGFLL